jgi:diacylglycerol kinase (ATP)
VTTPLREPAAWRATTGQALVIANPAAANVTASLVADLVAKLAAHDASAEVAWTSRPGAAADLAAGAVSDPDVELVVAVGGDGTVREVANGMSRAMALHHRPSRPALLALPAGSGNSTCRNLWGERDWPDVLDVAFDPALSTTRHLDLLRLAEPGVDVVLGASSGFLAQVLIGARQVTGLTGRDRYYAAAVDVLAAMPSHPTRVTVDGGVVHDGPASLAAVGGGRFRAYAFQFLPNSLLDDGELDVCVIGAVSGPAVDELAQLVPSGRHVGRPDVTYRRGRSVSIERTDGMPLVAEFDGEVWAAAGTTLTVEVVPGAVTVLAPRRALAG